MKMQPILTLVERAAQEGLRDAGRAVLELSNRLAPVDDGDLKKSGRVNVDDLTVQVSYTAPHAVFQHERLDFEHPDGGQAKFLEAAADAANVEAIVAMRVRAVLGG